MSLRRKAALVAALVLPSAGCVPATPEMLQRSASPELIQGVFPQLDPGAQEAQSLHFLTRAYGVDRSREISDQAEQDYARIMQDTGLYSFRFGGTYELVVYANAEEYRMKTQMPAWSGGATVGNAIYSYEGPHLRPTLAHEMSHLVFNEFMGRPSPELRWLNEGLAVYQELQSSAPNARRAWETRLDDARRAPQPFAQMTAAVPLNERDKDVSRWYQQAASVVRFMIERGGRLGFEQFLKSLKDGASMDAAVLKAYPGAWPSLAALEADWSRP